MKFTDLEMMASSHEVEIIRVKDIADTRLQQIQDFKNEIIKWQTSYNTEKDRNQVLVQQSDKLEANVKKYQKSYKEMKDKYAVLEE